MINLACAAVLIVNLSGEPWTDVDDRQLRFSKKRCYQKYGMEAPCLKEFAKKKFQTYNAICGKAKK